MLTIGDAREWARGLVPGSVQTIVTSPPYFGLRDYGTATWEGGDPACNHIQKHARDDESRIRKVDATSGRRARATEYENSSANPIHYRGTCGKCGALRVDQQMGLEATPDEFVANLVALFRDLRAALRDDGTLWLNLGDSYAGSSMTGGVGKGTIAGTQHGARKGADIRFNGNASVPEGMKPKDLIGIPWLTAFALRADGWYLRSAITWCKRASMPESVTDRPTSATEMVFLLSKQPRYYYDADAIREPAQQRIVTDTPMRRVPEVNNNRHGGGNDGLGANPAGRNARNYWLLGPEPFPLAHFAVFPSEIPRRAIRAGTSEKGACAACGSPWRRVVERTPMVIARSGRGEAMGEHGRTAASGTMLEPPTSTTVGWEPSCRCGTVETRPCVVCDPFMGSGTTAAVAVEENRAWVGCDLDPRAAGWLQGRLARVQRRLPLAM
jgi:hypothetical protein